MQAGERVYVTDQSGITYILEAGPTFKVAAAPELGEEVYATPAFVGGRIYLRAAGHLYGIGSP